MHFAHLAKNTAFALCFAWAKTLPLPRVTAAFVERFENVALWTHAGPAYR